MGYNTTVVVYNDALDDIAADPNFGSKLAAAIKRVGAYRNPEDVGACAHANAARVIETHHADSTAVVAIGGNDGTVLVTTSGWNHGDLDWQERVLKARLKEVRALKVAQPRDTPGMGC
jgi:hypothetical protein